MPLRFFLHQLLLDVRSHLRQRRCLAAALLLDLDNVEVRAQLDHVAGPPGRKIERHFFQRSGQRLALDPAPIAPEIARAVFGIHLRHALERRAIRELAQDLFHDGFLGCLISFRRVGRDHDQTQLHLFLGRELRLMLLIIFRDLRRRNHGGAFHILAPHRRDNNLVRLVLLELGQRVILGLERLDKSVAIAAEIFANNIVNALFDEMVGNFELFLPERLHDQLAIDQIL